MSSTADRSDVSHYSYRVSWSAEDGEYVATCAEFPSLSWLAESQVEALEGMLVLVRDVVADLVGQGEQVPQPLAERSYSGKFNVRVGESLHRELAIRAAEDGMSLNQYILRKLAAADGEALSFAGLRTTEHVIAAIESRSDKARTA
ncbi:type II toxin-antitoxin system HicB family antitoxin [Symbioplanes lichenis]|uniref:type II toxin-antitoxin system HicB family antitoxin n=1 Tax=Symbioplanes lichenis TaxID=1629072 RepID=UPI00273916A5|nr:type II toxin-antitoxin system HicB family antitoxin [Actinoplanes lichenis]